MPYWRFPRARGPVAQLGERVNRTHEARGSNPLGSTPLKLTDLDDTGVSISAGGDRCDREGTRSTRCKALGDLSLPRRGPQRRHDMSALRHRQGDLLQVAK